MTWCSIEAKVIKLYRAGNHFKGLKCCLLFCSSECSRVRGLDSKQPEQAVKVIMLLVALCLGFAQFLTNMHKPSGSEKDNVPRLDLPYSNTPLMSVTGCFGQAIYNIPKKPWMVTNIHTLQGFICMTIHCFCEENRSLKCASEGG